MVKLHEVAVRFSPDLSRIEDDSFTVYLVFFFSVGVGFTVALVFAAFRVTLTLTGVAEPLRYSLTVPLVTLLTGSLKVITMLAVRLTFVAFLAGLVVVTFGAVPSTLNSNHGEVPRPAPPASIAVTRQV